MKTLQKILIPILIFAWVFSGWPQIPGLPSFFAPQKAYATTATFTLSSGTNANRYGQWIVPANVTTADAACWGAGGGGGDGTTAGGAGGGGGAFASSTISDLVEGTLYTIFLGAKGTGATTAAAAGLDGGNSTFATTTVVAAGGTGGPGADAANSTGGAGGTVLASTGTTEAAGGQGGGGLNTGDKGGGGGGAAGPHGIGGDGSGQTGGTGDNTLGGAGGAPGTDNANGGGGGTGGNNGAAGAAGGNPGAGGGGGEGNGADGGGGQCVITYSALVAPTVSTDAETGVSASQARLNGNITATGGVSATERGFAWGTNSGLTGDNTATTSTTGSFGTGVFSTTISTLFAGLTYYYRAYAVNSIGTSTSGTIENLTTGTDTSTTRKMRLFEGFRIILISGRIILHQK